MPSTISYTSCLIDVAKLMMGLYAMYFDLEVILQAVFSSLTNGLRDVQRFTLYAMTGGKPITFNLPVS